MMPPVPVQIIHAVFDEETSFIVASVLFLENKMKRRFCWPASDLIAAFNIRGDVSPNQWKQFCKDITGKEIKMVCELVGDPEAPVLTYDQMSKVQADLIGRYFCED